MLRLKILVEMKKGNLKKKRRYKISEPKRKLEAKKIDKNKKIEKQNGKNSFQTF